MYVPAGKTFLVQPITFNGPCNAPKIIIQVEGSIVAPEVGKWNNHGAGKWLSFERIDGLVFTGSGSMDGSGSGWWVRTCKFSHTQGCASSSPTEIHFSRCNDLTVSNLSIMNSPQMSLVVLRCENVYINQLKITSPEYSPNTDGIHLSESQNVRIQNSIIGTGDDCISISDGTSNVVIDGITCGPGHGISIGSLGEDQSTATVEKISVSNSYFFNTTNGARIKTCQENAVHISDVKYNNFWGTSSKNYAVTLNCSKTVACTDIHLTNINITTVASSVENTEAACINAYGEADGYLNTNMSCLHYSEIKD
ncbi:Pectin lyase-like superfamily protein [Rhynchospora pubera]|uniref:Pectin lyase-like superfamily protein n=1 Tax=Rhynchospora pubera TaxID=906938 RepID=A0AAV8CPI9_9POAL|nr:Pectin lyase-like superfamily protein [Rhynchospora pubera]